MIVAKHYLNNTDLILYQELNMYHFNSDTTLLGKFINIGSKDEVLDIGCNNGALLLYAALHHPKKLVGIDLYPEILDIAKMNFEVNHFEAEFYCTKVQNFSHKQFDKIICNPPYFNSTNQKLMNENKYIRSARHEESLPMNELFKAVRRLLKDSGKFYYIHRPQELNRIQKSLMDNHLSIKTMQIYYNSKTNCARAISLEIVKKNNTQLLIKEPIYL